MRSTTAKQVQNTHGSNSRRVSRRTWITPFRSTPRSPFPKACRKSCGRLVIALVLVIIVVFIFLQGWRASLIPLLAVPVSLIGTFAFFPLFGFSINTLSLLRAGAGHRAGGG